MPEAGDRYRLPPDDPRQLWERLREIYRRLDELERANPIAAGAKVRNGRLVFSDETGTVERVVIGRLGDGTYGIQVLDGDGTTQRFRADEDGLHVPYLQASFIPVVNDLTDTRLCVVTSGSFSAYYRAQFGQVTHKGVGIRAICSTDVGTTAEFRILSPSGGTGNTDAVAVGSGGSVAQSFDWLHGLNLTAGPVYFDVECRRTSGGGNAYIWLPNDAIMRTGGGCTLTGV